MTNEKQFRELKFSSTQLVFVFLAILALSVFIFILGISVGKKQVELTADAGAITEAKTEALAQKQPLPGESTTTTSAPLQEQAKPEQTQPSQIQTNRPETKAKVPTEKKADEKNVPAKKAAGQAVLPETGAYFVQAGAMADKNGATAAAKTIENLGFPARVLEPLATDKKTVYRIRIGPYETREKALAALARIAAAMKKNKTDFFVVKS
jgi:cell division protein FtsN